MYAQVVAQVFVLVGIIQVADGSGADAGYGTDRIRHVSGHEYEIDGKRISFERHMFNPCSPRDQDILFGIAAGIPEHGGLCVLEDTGDGSGNYFRLRPDGTLW